MSPDVESKINALEVQLKILEDHLGDGDISVGGMIFQSKSFTDAWMKTNAPSRDTFMYFIDVHSMLSIGYGLQRFWVLKQLHERLDMDQILRH